MIRALARTAALYAMGAFWVALIRFFIITLAAALTRDPVLLSAAADQWSPR